MYVYKHPPALAWLPPAGGAAAWFGGSVPAQGHWHGAAAGGTGTGAVVPAAGVHHDVKASAGHGLRGAWEYPITPIMTKPTTAVLGYMGL
jgi:hypothetical protein